jgi:hypothetical protein
MKTLLISYTTLIAFIVLSSVMAFGFTQTNQASTTEPKSTTTLNSFMWVFDYKYNGEIVTSLASGAPASVNLAVSYALNTEDYGSAATPISAVKVIDPYLTGEDDLQVGMGKSIILADGSATVNDTYKGGDFIFNVNSGSVRRVEFDIIDAGDEIDTQIGGSRHLNNHYLKIFYKDGTQAFIDLDLNDGQNLPDRFVRHADSGALTKDVSKFVVHVSGSSSLDNLKVYSPVVPTTVVPTTIRPTSTPTLRPTSTPTLRPTSTPTLRPTSTPTLRPTSTPTVKPLVCTQWTTQKLYSGEFIASKANQRSYDLGTVSLSAVAKKYPIAVRTMWGWTGATDTNPQIGNAFNPRVQNNENHTVSIKYNDLQSSATKTQTSVCEDLGNTKTWDDGVNLLDINDPRTEYSKFKYCRKNITPEVNDGVASSVTYLNLEGKYDSISLRSDLNYTKAEFDSCVNNFSLRKCNQSHYSLVEVVTCAKEG